ncbi:MAG: NFACT RNA binding domain-containing protein [Desulfobacterales bacterium]|nr:NFACT RNA binding domain-containing protein [Desulfobacterales bacterium]
MPRLLGPRDRAAMTAFVPRRGSDRAARSASRAPAQRWSPGRARAASRFVSSDGLPILVGRDNEGNDYLTVHLARSEDLWLHVAGFLGIRTLSSAARTRTSGLPRRTLVEAAQLAAYYSQARDHGKVAVDYTLQQVRAQAAEGQAGPGDDHAGEVDRGAARTSRSIAKLAQGIDD